MWRGMIGLLTAVAICGSAQAAETAKGNSGSAAAGASTAKPAAQTIAESKVLDIKFPIPGFALADDGTYRSALNLVAESFQESCAAQEAFGWEFGKISTGETIVNATMAAIGQAGYTISPLIMKEFSGKNVFPSSLTKGGRRIALIWATDKETAMMLACETKAP